ncbi:prephenate dehydratase [Hanstruepera ponticola]|uniref:prephenate dehydratase n=1 Tax=Hanstruepera ponticola TaxID=2042995 RepID=UPI000CF07506|nr:prephenate dehydratase [Hanstruepera ponticola]
MIKSVAIQGVKGSFHHIVANNYFGDHINIREYLTFDKTVQSLLCDDVDAVVMALENSIAGSIIPNYALLDTNNLHVVGEYYLDIQHHLMALPNQLIEDIEEVHSHPMALLQCKEFFKQYPHIKIVEDADTAEVAKRIARNKTFKMAALGSQLASELYGLNIISESIQTIKHNETRFVVVKKENHEIPQSAINKASLKFELEHKRGSLAAMLNVMSDCQLNLTKIQSLPKIETPWKYAFFIDVTFDNYKNFEKAKTIMEIMTEEFKILGEYKNAKP